MKPEYALVTLAKQLAGRNGHAKVASAPRPACLSASPTSPLW
jgi:hypothetical protein